MKSKPNTWTPERAKQWRREYKARRRQQDPSFRARENQRCLKAMEKLRGWKRYEKWAVFPFGYEPPPGIEGHDLFIDFQIFLDSIILPGHGTLSAYYWKHRFDPRCSDAHQRWNAIITELKQKFPDYDPLQKFKERANRLIMEEQASYHTGHRIT